MLLSCLPANSRATAAAAAAGLLQVGLAYKK